MSGQTLAIANLSHKPSTQWWYAQFEQEYPLVYASTQRNLHDMFMYMQDHPNHTDVITYMIMAGCYERIGHNHILTRVVDDINFWLALEYAAARLSVDRAWFDMYYSHLITHQLYRSLRFFLDQGMTYDSTVMVRDIIRTLACKNKIGPGLELVIEVLLPQIKLDAMVIGTPVMSWLIKYTPDLIRPYLPSLIPIADRFNNTILHIAAITQQHSIFDEILAYHPSLLQANNDEGLTPSDLLQEMSTPTTLNTPL